MAMMRPVAGGSIFLKALWWCTTNIFITPSGTVNTGKPMSGTTIKVLIRTAGKLASELDSKAIVILHDVPDEYIENPSLPVIVAGSTFDISGDIKRIPLPQNLDTENTLNLISAFLFEHEILREGESFVYVSPDSIGIKVIKKGLTTVKGFFSSAQTVLQRVLEIAIELSIEGREGVKLGTLFVIGDVKRVLKHSHQMIPNPFKGHKINVLDKRSKEIIKEFALLDGAFVISSTGRILSAGRYLDIDFKKLDLMLPPGLGSRHVAAAGITKLTKATSVSLSESGTIRVFKNGIMILEYNPRIKY